jgi:hypothetical protein
MARQIKALCGFILSFLYWEVLEPVLTRRLYSFLLPIIISNNFLIASPPHRKHSGGCSGKRINGAGN